MNKKESLQTRERSNYCPPVSQTFPMLTEGALAVSNTEDIIDDPNKYGWN